MRQIGRELEGEQGVVQVQVRANVLAQGRIGSQLQHSLSIFSAELGELLWGEAQVRRNP